nr:hypothetical protein [Lysinibacillus timonensis]
MFREPLSQEERSQLLETVTEQQRDFLNHKVKRGRETIFANFMLSEKVHAIMSADDIELQENELDVVDWKIVHYDDHGLGNRHGKCACGRSLRYEFTVQHLKTKKTITYGKDHLAQFLNLNVSDIDAVMNNLRVVDFELDELLCKIKHDDYGYELVDELEGKIEIPKDIQEHVNAEIPLLNRQIRRLEKQIQQFETEEASKRHQALTTERNEKQAAEQKARNEQIETYLKAKKLIQQRFEIELKEKQTKQQQVMDAVNQQLPPNAHLGEMAFAFIQNGITSATEISHLIRDYYNVDKKVSTSANQRPYIYMEVLHSLMAYTDQGYLTFDEEASSIEDCIFYMNEEGPIVKTTEDTPTEFQATLF